MAQKLLVALKVTVLVTTLIIAVIGIMYVLDVFSGEALRKAIEKIVTVFGIVTLASLVVIFLSDRK